MRRPHLAHRGHLHYAPKIVDGERAIKALYSRAPAAAADVRESGPPDPRPPRFLDRVRQSLRASYGSRRTEKKPGRPDVTGLRNTEAKGRAVFANFLWDRMIGGYLPDDRVVLACRGLQCTRSYPVPYTSSPNPKISLE